MHVKIQCWSVEILTCLKFVYLFITLNCIFLLAAWYTKTISFTVCFLFVCLLVTPSTNFGSRYLVEELSEGDKIWQLDREDLAIHHHPDWWTLAQEVPLQRQNREGCKKICNAFIIRRSDEIWYDAGIDAQQVLRDFGKLWSTFGEHRFSTADISHFLSHRDENWQG